MERKKINVDFEIETTEKPNGMFSCRIVDTDMYFSAKTAKDIEIKGRAFIKMYISFWNEYKWSNSKKDFTSMMKKI